MVFAAWPVFQLHGVAIHPNLAGHAHRRPADQRLGLGKAGPVAVFRQQQQRLLAALVAQIPLDAVAVERGAAVQLARFQPVVADLHRQAVGGHQTVRQRKLFLHRHLAFAVEPDRPDLAEAPPAVGGDELGIAYPQRAPAVGVVGAHEPGFVVPALARVLVAVERDHDAAS